jgi:hypothetical protein
MAWPPSSDDDLEALPVDGPGGESPYRWAGGDAAGSHAGGGAGAWPAATESGPGGWSGRGGHRGRGYRAASLSTAVLLLAAVGALTVVPGHDSPTRALAEIRDFVASHRTAHFVAVGSNSIGPGTAESLGHTMTTRSRASGAIRLPGESHVVIEAGDYAIERITLTDRTYSRHADDVSALARQQWVTGRSAGGWFAYAPGAGTVVGPEPGPLMPPAEIGSSGGGNLLPVMLSGGLGVLADAGVPVELESLLAKAQHPLLVEPGHLRATVPMTDLLSAPTAAMLKRAAAGIAGAITFDVAYGPDGRLDSIVIERVMTIDGDRTAAHDAVVFTQWGEPVDIAPPSEGNVDHTPTIDESALAAVSDMTVLAPTTVPAPWKLTSVDVEQEDRESEDCEAVTVEYMRGDVDPRQFDNSEDDPPTVSITSVPASCPWLDSVEPSLENATPVSVGPWRAQLVENVDDNTYSYLSSGITAVLNVNGTYVVASTNAGRPLLVSMLSGLARLDLGRQPIADEALLAAAGD